MQELIIIIQQIIILILLLCLPWDQYERRFKGWWKKYWQKSKQARHLRPRDPSSCAACCSAQHLANQERGQASPWERVKSRRGRPKAHSSGGYACMNPRCPYYKVTDERVHALRRDGTRNQEATPQWECGWCDSKRTAWYGTVQYRLKTHSDMVRQAIHMQMKGMCAADISEILEVPPDTVQGWLDRVARHTSVCSRTWCCTTSNWMNWRRRFAIVANRSGSGRAWT